MDKKASYIEPDRDLMNWEKWIQIREDELVNIGQKIGRQPIDMVMNLHERVREDKEWKTVLENAHIEKKATLRGALWDQPERLKQKCYCEPVYEIHRKPEDIGQPGIIEHIGVPQYILENEKGVHGTSERNKCVLLNKKFQDYKESQENKLKDKIKLIDPYRSEISELFVKGNKPKPPPPPLPILPEIVISTACECEETYSVCAVRINNTILIKDLSKPHLTNELSKLQQEKWHESCSTWSYYFNVPKNRVGRAKLFLQNLGTVTLRYCWKKIKEQIPFIPEEITNQVFFFNKNEDILSPGQSREVYFTFISNDIGLYRESWEISFFNVSFCATQCKMLVINLQADTVEDVESIRRKIDILKVRINRKAVRKLIKDMLNDAFEKATTVEPHIYPYKKLLLESELFIMKNPVCFYHQTEVMKLKQVYTEMMPDETWDLSMSTWRDAMMKKDFDDRMRYFDILKQSYRELLKPWNEGESHLIQKQSAVKYILSKLADKFDLVYFELINEGKDKDQSTEEPETATGSKSSIAVNTDLQLLTRLVFHMRMREHVKNAIETCAGVMGSLDLNRWIHFDFCA
ncbi:uncharacterized protein [Battus philenor]|uniref:uncharacterized protein n=1 Tax=Battus philenor TaxID=42288 RepID=UPI0035D080B4